MTKSLLFYLECFREMNDEIAKEEYPWEGSSVYTVFSRLAENIKDKVFIQHAEDSITYGDLLEKVNQASESILSLALDADRPVAVNLPSGSSWAIVVLALLKAGHFYIPIDPDFPKERNDLILLNSNASIVIGLFEESTIGDIDSITVDSLLQPLKKVDQNKEVNSNAKACIIYTSGSTGIPKGVIQTHQSILHGVWRRSKLQNITQDDRMTWLYSPSVKGSEYCFFVALLNGASLYVRKIMDHFDDQFIDWMIFNKITVYHSVASYFRYVAGSLEASSLSLDHLRLVILGGERVLKTDVDLFFANFNNSCRLYTALGSTETGTVCHFPFEELASLEQAIVPIGYPVKGVTLEILDENGNSIKEGVGRLSVKSKYISPGYWNEPSDRFILNSETGKITYVSGDLAEFDTHGVLHHRGRADDAVKINGYLVNLLEVEEAIMKYKDVQEVRVIAHDVNYQTRLYAFIETTGTKLDIEHLKVFLSNNLVKQMVPYHYKLIQKWPRLANGKINKKELVMLLEDQPNTLEKSQTTEYEEQVLKIWQKVLSVNDIPVDKTFTEAGGDSVATLGLALQFKKAGFTSVNLVDLIKNNTISKQAILISQINSK